MLYCISFINNINPDLNSCILILLCVIRYVGKYYQLTLNHKYIIIIDKLCVAREFHEVYQFVFYNLFMNQFMISSLQTYIVYMSVYYVYEAGLGHIVVEYRSHTVSGLDFIIIIIIIWSRSSAKRCLSSFCPFMHLYMLFFVPILYSIHTHTHTHT